jgi:hypothetical protein
VGRNVIDLMTNPYAIQQINNISRFGLHKVWLKSAAAAPFTAKVVIRVRQRRITDLSITCAGLARGVELMMGLAATLDRREWL